MRDPELNALMEDIVKVLHDLEWWESGDICEETYRKTVTAFKGKWLGGKGRVERLTGIINKRIEAVRRELLTMIGVNTHGQYDGEEDAGAISP